MGRRAGSADLPLHGGRVPAWLGQRMTKLGTGIAQAIVLEYGRDEFLRRLAHPFWFQSFGAVMGMDWHSSGITTSVLGALKRGLAPLSAELGIHACGGRGKHSRATPIELSIISERVGIDGVDLARSGRARSSTSRTGGRRPREPVSSTCLEHWPRRHRAGAGATSLLFNVTRLMPLAGRPIGADGLRPLPESAAGGHDRFGSLEPDP